jgi:hypothetical protein
MGLTVWSHFGSKTAQNCLSRFCLKWLQTVRAFFIKTALIRVVLVKNGSKP